MNKLKRFSQAELKAYIADHPVVHDPTYKSEPHTVVKAVDKLFPVGTKVFTFRDKPYLILEGKIVEHQNHELFNYRCEWFDPILNQTYIDSCMCPCLTREKAEEGYRIISGLLLKHGSKKQK
jgi:hypothetical protein